MTAGNRDTERREMRRPDLEVIFMEFIKDRFEMYGGLVSQTMGR